MKNIDKNKRDSILLLMGTFESKHGTETVNVPQEAITVMQDYFGDLQEGYSEECISPKNAQMGPFENVSYGYPYADDRSSKDNLLHFEYSVELEYELEKDIQLLEGIKQMRKRMHNLGFSAKTNSDQRETGGYGDWYYKNVSVSDLHDELRKLMGEFGDCGSKEGVGGGPAESEVGE